MFSRIANVTSVSQKTSLLYRMVNTTAAASSTVTSSAAAPPHSTGTKPPTGPHAYPHDAPERDFANYPPFRVPEEAARTRMWFIPENWVLAMYEKTGVTGPYVLFWGAIATAFSKEYYVTSVDTPALFAFVGTMAVLGKYAWPKISAFLNKEQAKQLQQQAEDQAATVQGIVDKVEELNALQSLTEANALIHAAKKENVQLQLEGAYRERLMQVYNDVKKRLDYQISMQNAYKRVEREQAINYINGEVAKAIGASQEKEAFQSGLEQLKVLSKKYAGQI